MYITIFDDWYRLLGNLIVFNMDYFDRCLMLFFVRFVISYFN